MAAAIGADVEQLRSLAKQFAQSADRLEQGSSGLSRVIANAAYWRGNDANQFRTQWRSQSTPSITAAVKTLRTAADALVHNADEQDQASAAGGGTASPDTGNPDPSYSVLRKAPDGLSDMWNEVKGMPNDSGGYRIQKIVGADDQVRYIVYIGGDAAQGDNAWYKSDRAAINGKVDKFMLSELERLIPHDAEVMMVGYSQGGMDAQNIAANSQLNITNIVTFGSPARKDLDVPSINLIADGDRIAAMPTIAAGDRWTLNPSDSNSTVFRGDPGVSSNFIDNLNDPYGKRAHEGYANVVDQFYNSGMDTNALAGFQGDVVDQLDLSVGGVNVATDGSGSWIRTGQY
jgi:uncharacterized protein YukE